MYVACHNVQLKGRKMNLDNLGPFRCCSSPARILEHEGRTFPDLLG